VTGSIEQSAPPRRRRKAEWRMIAGPTDPAHVQKPARVLAIAEGYAMVRRAGHNAAPFIITQEVWDAADQQEARNG